MAKKETKRSTKEIINLTIKTLELAIAPAAITTGTIWGFDIAVYVTAITGALTSVLACVNVFLKD